ncbi:hypothetical protein [Flavobacterium sp. JP2137]
MKSFDEKANEVNKRSEETNLGRDLGLCPKCTDVLTSENNHNQKNIFVDI